MGSDPFFARRNTMSPRYIPLSWPRRLIGDLMHFARKVPSIPVERPMDLAALARARATASPAPGWTALFVKGFGLASREFKDLRTSFISNPWDHLVLHDRAVASVAVAKNLPSGEQAVLFTKIRGVENMPLGEIDAHLHKASARPVDDAGGFRLARRISMLPRFLRRLVWWLTLEWSGTLREKYFGTFGVSSYGVMGAESLHPLSPLAATLNFGPISPEGLVRVRIIYDHRVCDGGVIASALKRLEAILNTELVAELNGAPRHNNPLDKKAS